MLKLIASAGTNASLSSRYFAQVCALPIAIIATWGLNIVGTKQRPPMFPTLDTLKVESAKSEAVSAFFADLSIRTFKSASIYKMLFVWTALIFGTVSPSLLSIATLKLWFFLITNRWMNPSESRSLSTQEFIRGYSVIAIEQAFTKKGSMVSLG